MVYVSFAAVRRTFGIGQILREHLAGRCPANKVCGKIAVQQRNDVLAGSEGKRHAHRGRLVPNADRYRSLHLPFLEQFKDPLLQSAGEVHKQIPQRIERFPRQPVRKPRNFQKCSQRRCRRLGFGRGNRPVLKTRADPSAISRLPFNLHPCGKPMGCHPRQAIIPHHLPGQAQMPILSSRAC